MTDRYPPRKWVPIQHSVYLAGWKDLLHAIGDEVDERRKAGGKTITLRKLEQVLAKYVPR